MIQRAAPRRPKEKDETRQGVVRVAIYTRKSTEFGLDQEFTSIDAQREACEAYIQSQRSKSWTKLPEAYEDGGFSGATVDRPAFQRLHRDIEAGLVDVVTVYKHDRLSRSFLDFYKILEFFEAHGVTFVAVTQNFDTSGPVGRLLLNMLMSFAEFERAQNAERTRDKLRAATAKGMWTGGIPVLGYDVKDKKLVVNKKEAKIVQGLFDLYLKLGSMMAVVAEANRLGWKTKTRVTQSGETRPGKPFMFGAIRALLQRQVYLAKIESRGQVFDGQHEAIIDQETWDAVQRLIRRNTMNGGTFRRRKPSACLLSGMLFCGVCGARMTHELSASDGGKRKYRYYRCATITKHGFGACPGSRVPAGEIEEFLVERIRAIGQDPSILAATLAAGKAQLEARKPEIEAGLKELGQEREQLRAKQRRLVHAIGEGDGPKSLVEELEKVEAALDETKVGEVRLRDELAALKGQTIDEASLKAALASFEEIWAHLVLEEQARIIHLLIEKVVCNVAKGTVDVTFRPGGIQAFAEERSGDDDDPVSD